MIGGEKQPHDVLEAPISGDVCGSHAVCILRTEVNSVGVEKRLHRLHVATLDGVEKRRGFALVSVPYLYNKNTRMRPILECGRKNHSHDTFRVFIRKSLRLRVGRVSVPILKNFTHMFFTRSSLA